MSTKLGLKQQEKIFKKLLGEYFLPKGFKYFHEYQNTNFHLSENLISSQFTIFATTIGHHSFIGELSFNLVESIIHEISKPNEDFTKLINNEKLYTIKDNGFNVLYPTLGTNSIDTEEDCILYSQRIISYMENEGKAFVEKYSYLPNVLAEMDRLENEGMYWTGIRGKGGILSGMGDAFYRGLVISKLCNDKKFDNKIELVKQIFDLSTDWLENYYKLIERLKTLDPICNI